MSVLMRRVVRRTDALPVCQTGKENNKEQQTGNIKCAIHYSGVYCTAQWCILHHRVVLCYRSSKN